MKLTRRDMLFPETLRFKSGIGQRLNDPGQSGHALPVLGRPRGANRWTKINSCTSGLQKFA